MVDLKRYLEDYVAISLIELAMEGFIHWDGNKVLYLPHRYTWNLYEGQMEEIHILISVQCKAEKPNLTRVELIFKKQTNKNLNSFLNTPSLRALCLVVAEKGERKPTHAHYLAYVLDKVLRVVQVRFF